MRLVWIPFVAAVMSIGCQERGERRASIGAPTGNASSATPNANAAPTASAPMPAGASSAGTGASASASVNANPATAEVEIFGKIVLPAGAPKNGKLVVYVAQDDCLKNDAQILGHLPAATTNGSFAIEVFPKWGTDISICGASEDDKGNATWYGKATSKAPGAVFHAEQTGEVTFNNVEIPLKKGPTHNFPHDAAK